MDLIEKDQVRFWVKVALPNSNGCMLWLASCRPNGYGQFKLKGKTHPAHRVSYELANGSTPEGAELDHLCRVRHCVAPAHLEAVTHLENVRRGAAGAHWRAKTHCPQGHPYDEANTYTTRRGFRMCRKCHAAQEAARYRV